MKFVLKAETFHRIGSICNFFEPDVTPEWREKLKVLRLEIINERVFALATNKQIAAIEWIGCTEQKNGVARVIVTPELLDQCRRDALVDADVEVLVIPEIAMATLRTTTGYSHQGNCCNWTEDVSLTNWKNWPSREPVTKPNGFMYMDLYHIQSLLASSPSGKIIFPEFIDADKPVVVRDALNASWVGLFVPNNSKSHYVESAKLPDWW